MSLQVVSQVWYMRSYRSPSAPLLDSRWTVYLYEHHEECVTEAQPCRTQGLDKTSVGLMWGELQNGASERLKIPKSASDERMAIEA